MRFSYRSLTFRGETTVRPCVSVTLKDDPDATAHLALLDTGSPLTIIPMRTLSMLFGMKADLMPAECHLPQLGFGGLHDRNVPVRKFDLEIVPPDQRWEPIPLPGTRVACTSKHELPFFILGSEALANVVTLFRERERIVHVKPMDLFQTARHFEDEYF